jgi:hypothetical protein
MGIPSRVGHFIAFGISWAATICHVPVEPGIGPGEFDFAPPSVGLDMGRAWVAAKALAEVRPSSQFMIYFIL